MKKMIVIGVAILAVLLVIAALINQKPDEPKEPAVDAGVVDTQPTEDAPSWVPALPSGLSISAKSYFVFDCQQNTYTVASQAPTDKCYPTGITKLFTAYVALQYLQQDARITVGEGLNLVKAGSNLAELEKGDVVNPTMLVRGMILADGSDAAYILAEEAGRAIKNDPAMTAADAVNAFVEEMNLQAQNMGLTGTKFLNPDGYHTESQYTCYSDLVAIAGKAMENPVIMEAAKLDRMTEAFYVGGPVHWKNNNALVDPDSANYCPYALGLKTGSDSASGNCLLTALDVNGQRYVVGVFGCAKEEDCATDTLLLLNELIS